MYFCSFVYRLFSFVAELSNFQIQVEDNRQQTVITNSTGRSIVLSKSSHSVLEAMMPLQAGILPMCTSQNFVIDGQSVAEYSWKYFVNYDGREHSKLVTQVSRQIWVRFTPNKYFLILYRNGLLGTRMLSYAKH